MKTRRTTAILLLSLQLLALGCQTSARRAPLPVKAEDNTAKLMQHPQFPAAARAAPEFLNEVFQTITRLEREKANAGVP